MDKTFAEISGHPWDSHEGLVQGGLDPRIYGSCSMPTGDNAGCAYHAVCSLRRQRKNLREQIDANGNKVMRETPVNVGYAKVFQQSGVGNLCISSCWDYHRNGSAREHLHPEEGTYLKIIAYEGEQALQRRRIKTHGAKPDCPQCKTGVCKVHMPGILCEGCAKHGCTLHDDKEWPTPIPAFECFSDYAAYGQGERLKAAMLDKSGGIEQERMEAALDRFKVDHRKPVAPAQTGQLPMPTAGAGNTSG